MSIRRCDVTGRDGDMEDQKQGDWVLYDDYAAEVAKLKARVAELEEAAHKSLTVMLKVLGDCEPDDPAGPFDAEMELACTACQIAIERPKIEALESSHD